ncbi:unnamed protein product [Schistocephalus solidus]|uniref:Reverse transcriptase domain-containing protein n=1 Tax=Schistocephalus solidus TaxID=70667 RepID=A0A183TL36_SCHSO|nr:unnamed protein product [Schistocephalus solidus]
MLVWTPLTGTQISPVAPRNWVLPSGHTPGKRHDWRAKPARLGYDGGNMDNEAFAVTNGMKQGCVLAPTLFSFMFSAMLIDAYRDERPGIRIAYWMNATIHELLFTDDCAPNATTEEDMQMSVDLFAATCDNFGLCSNTEKTMVMHHLPPNTTYNATCVNVNGAQLKAVHTLTYLGSNLS